MVERLIDATAQVLSDVGLEGLSTNKVAQAAGVSVGASYQYFPDKAALVDAVVLDRFKKLRDVIEQRMGEVQDFTYRPAAETVLRATVDFFAAEPGLTEILAPYLAVPPNDPDARDAIAWVRDLVATFLRVVADEVAVEQVDLAAYVSIGIVSHFAPRLATISDPDERERHLAEVVELLVRYVGAR